MVGTAIRPERPLRDRIRYYSLPRPGPSQLGKPDPRAPTRLGMLVAQKGKSGRPELCNGLLTALAPRLDSPRMRGLATLRALVGTAVGAALFDVGVRH